MHSELSHFGTSLKSQSFRRHQVGVVMVQQHMVLCQPVHLTWTQGGAAAPFFGHFPGAVPLFWYCPNESSTPLTNLFSDSAVDL
mmetsp:Transcript_17881/g.50011  ORF Transcript_17881/g.50011 Transcript_17881/m.50011 type:complete len:84 (-) Transcript_17881:3411-3662(-)